MTWVNLGPAHYNTAAMQKFFWKDEMLTIVFANGGYTTMHDPGKRLYEKLCETVRVRGYGI